MAEIHKAIAFIILGITALLISGYLFINGDNITFSDLKGFHISSYLPSGFLTKFNSRTDKYISAELEINGTLNGDLDFPLKNTKITLEFDGEEIELSNAYLYVKGNITLINYSGEFMYSPLSSVISLNGKSEGFFTDTLSLRYSRKETTKINQTNIRRIKIQNILNQKISLKGFKGTIKVKVKGDSITYLSSNKDIDISNVDGVLILNGDHILFEGKGVIKSDVLLTPIVK